MGDVLKKFGRYFLLDHIAQGGMAEIYRSRMASAEGAGRLIVIKKIQSGFGTNAEFLKMFKSEIKVTMGFNHPNIVQVYDFGEENHQPYIAMELVDGKNLRQFISRFAELKQSFPIELATYIAEQASSGLNYAHSYRDKISGVSLNIVHRDISPQNILISYEGTVKVIDFGIAKATTNLETTRAGIIKGKPSYLSPEQISGETLDGRSDIFALGTVLWELLTGKKLFAGENDLAVLKLIESCQTHVKPPSTLNPKVPKELDYIVLKTLSKSRDKRYQNAEELQRALHKFLYSYMPEFNPSDLSYYAKDLFKNEIVEDRKRLQKLNDKVEQLLSFEVSEKHLDDDVILETRESQKKEDTTIVDARLGSTANEDREFSKNESENAGKIEMEPVPKFQSRASDIHSTSKKESKKNPHTLAAPTQRPLPSSPKGSLSKTLGLLILVTLIVGILGPQFGIRLPFFIDHKSDQKLTSNAATSTSTPTSTPTPTLTPSSLSTITLGSSEKTILLKLILLPTGATAQTMISGKKLDPRNLNVQAPLDSPLEITVDQEGFRPFRREFVLDSHQINGAKEWVMEIPLEPLHYGYLSLHTTPSAEATLSVHNYSWKRKTPLENEKLPVGKYSIRLFNDVLGMEKKLNLEIEEGKAQNLDVKLEITK